MSVAPVTDRPTHATVALVRSILEAHPEGLTDDRLWQLTGLPFNHHGSVVKRRLDAGAKEVVGRRGVSLSGRSCRLWALPVETEEQS